MKNILIILLLSSFIFCGINFNKSMVYGGLDETVTVGDAYGVDFDLNDNMSIGYDTAIGMLVKADGPVNLSIRIGYASTTTTSTLGVGYNWWTGGETIKTSIGTILDFTTAGSDTEDSFVRINIGWGF